MRKGEIDEDELEFQRLVKGVSVHPGRAKPRRRERFVMVPALWRERLTKARHIATYRVALHILARNFETHGKSFALPNAPLALEGVSRRQKWRALEELEQLELIAAERRKRRSPWITVLG
jgi:hypothetical protein